MQIRYFFLLMLTALFAACAQDQGEPTEFLEYGWIEPVAISGEGIVLYAKLDTGADNCSLHAGNIKLYKKKGADYVKFHIRTRQGEEYDFDLPVARFAKIKRVEGATQVRPVVSMYICLGGQYMQVDVNLVDRSNFAYPLLIGRSFLAGHAMVNPAKSFVSEPQCVLPEIAR
jgi:hypothetical protein